MGETAAAAATTDRPRMAYVPALDGLRGLAVLAVLAYHHGYGWARGGFLGVSLFFTLSGFLIASLVLREYDATGRIDLRAFWARRIRRLAPAGLLGIVLALGALIVAVPEAQRAASLTDVRAALVQLSNWRFVLADAPYVDIGTTPSPVLHYWSLAIEEQFYVVFPVVALLALRRGRRTLAVTLTAVTVGSVALQLGLPADDRVYFGTDTRAAELALGVLLAIGWKGLRERLGPRAWDVVGAAGLVATLLAWGRVSPSDPALLGGGLAAVGVVSVVVLAGALGGELVPRALAATPLRWLGLASYGLYVVHFPIFLVFTPSRTGLDGHALFATRVAVSLAVAVASLLLVERPIRTGRPILGWTLRGRPAGAVMVAGLMVLALATIPLARTGPAPGIAPTGLLPTAIEIAPVATPAPSPSPDATASPAGAPTTPAVDAPDAPDAPDASDASDGSHDPVDPAPTEDAATSSTVEDETEDGEAVQAPARADGTPSRPPRLVVVGDSTAEANGGGLQAWGERTGGVQVSVVSSPGCAVLFGEVARYREGFEFRPTGCEQLFPTAVEEVARVDADAMVVFIGAPQLADWRFGADRAWRNITEPDIGRAYRDELDDLLASMATMGVPVLWADVPVPDWDLDSFGDLLGGDLPGTGEPVINDPARTQALNAHTLALHDAHAGVATVAYVDGMAGTDGAIAPGDRADGLHMSEAQVVAAADDWLVTALADAHDRAWAELGAAPPEAVVWTPAEAAP